MYDVNVLENRAILEDRLDEYLDTLVVYAEEAIDEQLGGGLFGSLKSFGARKKLPALRSDMAAQCDAVLDYAVDIAHGDGDQTGENVHQYEHTQQFLDTNPFLQMMPDRTPDQRAAYRSLQEDLLTHYNDVAHDIGDVLRCSGDSFGELMHAAYPDREDAEQVMQKNFETAKTIAGYAEHMSLGFLGDFFASFEDDIQPVIAEGEERLWHRISDDLDAIYRK